jgi:hypothetical protein
MPDSFTEMEPLFSAVICGCNAGLFREALHEVYIARIQRGNASFAAKVLGATGPLLAVLVHFFEDGRWGSPVETTIEEQTLSGEDQLFIFMQAGAYLTATRGFAAPEAHSCYERAESLCNSLQRLPPYSALIAKYTYSLVTNKLSTTMQIAKGFYSLAQERNDPTLLMGACRALANTLYFSGDFELARQYAMLGLRIWRSGIIESPTEEVTASGIAFLYVSALCHRYAGEIASCQSAMADAISLAEELNDMHGLAVSLFFAGSLWHFERSPVEVARFASRSIELTAHQNFSFWRGLAAIHRGWACSISGRTAEGLLCIENGIWDYRTAGSILLWPYILAIKAEALYLADRTSEALEATNQAEALAERFEQRYWSAELHRLRAVFLTALGAEETKIEASFGESIRIAKQQKAISLQKRAEASHAEYRRQKASGSAGRGFRIPLY